MKDAEHPFFRPLWRRIALVVFCAAWSIFEFFWNGSRLWGTLAGGMAVYAAWVFLLNYPPPSMRESKPAENPPPAEKE